MNKHFKLNVLAAAVAATSLFASATALSAEYDVQAIDASDVTASAGQAKYDMEEGKFASVGSNNTSIEVFDLETNQKTVIADNGASKSNVGMSGGVAFWTEGVVVGHDTSGVLIADQLYKFENGSVTQITDDQFSKKGFTYDNGQATWFQNEEAASGRFGKANLYVYDGTDVAQASDDADTVTKFDNNYKSIKMDNGQVVYSAGNAIYLWDGFANTKITPDTYNAEFADIDNGVVVFSAQIDGQEDEQVYKYENGTIEAVTSEVLGYTGFYKHSIESTQIDGGVISWEIYDRQFQRSELFVSENGVTTQIDTDMAYGDAVLSNGNVYWKNGAAQVGSTVMSYVDGEVSEVYATGMVTGLDASGGDVMLFDNTSGIQTWHLASEAPEAEETTVINLGSEHAHTYIYLDKPVTIVVDQWSGWSWTPGNIGIGISTTDGSELHGLEVRDSDGNVYNLNTWWDSVTRPFYWEPVTLTIPAQHRAIRVEWWAAG